MDTLKVANERGIDWQFVRVGEEFEDIENISSDNFCANNLAINDISLWRRLLLQLFLNYYLQPQIAMIFSLRVNIYIRSLGNIEVLYTGIYYNDNCL